MYSRLTHIYLLILFANLSFGQTFVKSTGDPLLNDGVTCLLESNNIFYLGGYSGEQAFIQSLDKSGAELWATTIDFTEYLDVISDLEMHNGSLVGCGYGNESGAARFEEFFFKFDISAKDFEWVYKNSLKLKPSSLHVLPNGNYLFLGDEYANNRFGLFMLELDAKTGKKVNFTTWYYSGKESSSASLIVDDKLITAGRYGLKPKVDKYRGAISSFSLDGATQNWTKYYLNSKTRYAKSYLSSLKRDNDFLIAGFFTNNLGIQSEFTISLAQTDLEGNINWAFEYVPKEYTNITLRDIFVLSDGYLIYGFTKKPGRDLFLLKTDKSGMFEWAKSYGDLNSDDVATDQGALMHVDQKNIYLVGQTKNYSANNLNNALFIKLNRDGSSDLDCWGEEMAFSQKSYLDLIEGEIRLSQYDTSFKMTRVDYVILDEPSKESNFICLPKMAVDDYDTIQNGGFGDVAFLKNDRLNSNAKTAFKILSEPKFGSIEVLHDTLIHYTASNKNSDCIIDSFQYALFNDIAGNDTASIYIYTLVQADKEGDQERFTLPENGGIKLTSSIEAETYKWNTGANGSTISVTQPGTYSVFGQSASCLIEQSFTVIENPYSFDDVATNNICFLLDVSLSMNRADRLPVLKQSLFNVIRFMRAEDKFSVVTYNDEAKLILDGVSATESEQIVGKIDSLASDGQSDIVGGVIMGSKAIENNFQTEGNNRIIFTTDGDISNEKRKELSNAITKFSSDYSFTIFLFNKSTVYTNQMQELANEVGGSLVVVTEENMEEKLLLELKAVRR